jgi:hypothetical protein
LESPPDSSSNKSSIPRQINRTLWQKLYTAPRFFGAFVFTARIPVVSAAFANGNDFSNNLFSDLGPVLALFGEQVAKQFMAGSMGWEDNILFAMVRLGGFGLCLC